MATVEHKSKGKCLYKTSCGCGSGDGKQVYVQEDGSLDAYCWACETYDPMNSDNVVSIKPMKESKMRMIDVDKLPTLAIPDRGLRLDTVENFPVKIAVSEKDGTTITNHYYADHRDGELIGYEARECATKSFSAVGDRKGDFDLWNQHNCERNGKKLFVFEGRLDAMSLFQTVTDNRPAKYSKYAPNIVSLTRGAASAVKDLLANRSFVEGYSEVVLCFDNDEAGKRATKEVLRVFPLFKVANLGKYKDANEMLMDDKSNELYTACVWNGEHIRQGEVVDVRDIIVKAMERPKMGLSFPWPTVTKATFGIRPHNIHIVGAAPKIGKSDWQYQLVHHLCYSENVKVGMFDLENSPVRTAKKLASKEARLDFTRPDKEYEDQLLHDTLVAMDGRVRFYDRGASRDWSDIRVAIEEMHLLDNINIFIIDPLTALVSRYNSSEANDKLNEIATDMADLVNLYPITIFGFSHVNPKPKGARTHEQGAKVLSGEFTGSRALEKWCHYGHGISRDRSDDCPPEEKNMSKFYMLFDREYGQSYNADVYFDEPTVTYLEATKQWQQ